MAIIFVDFAIDIPPSIKEKMPSLRTVSRKIYENGTRIDLQKAKENIKNNKSVEFEALSVKDFKNEFIPTLKEGNDIVYLSISAKFSNSVKLIDQVIKELKEEFPNQKIVHIDTCNLSLASGYLAYYAHRLDEQGVDALEIKKVLDNHKSKKYCFFIVDDLKHLKNSGKIDETVLSGGVKLNVKQILTISPKGELEKYGQVIGAKKSIIELASLAQKYGRNIADHRLGIIYAGNIQRAFDLRNSLLEMFNIEDNIDIMELNPQISACTGDGFLGIVFNGKRVR